MKSPFTTTIDQSLLIFLTKEAKRQKVHRNVILEKALKLYKNLKLEMAVKEGLEDRQQEYRDIARDFVVMQKYVLRHL